MSWGLSYFLIDNIIRKYQLSKIGMNRLFIGNFVASFIGAKVLFLIVMTKSDKSHLELITRSAFWLGGGFVFYGGFLATVFFTFIFCLKLKKYPWTDFSYWLPAVALAHGLGRVGCFFSGCCFGVECNLPWAVLINNSYRHPVQIYEAIALMGLSFIGYKCLEKRSAAINIKIYVGGYAAIRFILEFFRGDHLRGNFGFVSTSQMISLILFFIVLYFQFRSKIIKQSEP
jgi:phosphatidylglycerol:prolipoprotein diacylglycerol transferase